MVWEKEYTLVQWFLGRKVFPQQGEAFWKLWKGMFGLLNIWEESSLSFNKVGSRDSNCLALHNKCIHILCTSQTILTWKWAPADVWTQVLFYVVLMCSLFTRKCNWCVNWEEYDILLCLKTSQKWFIISKNYEAVLVVCVSGWQDPLLVSMCVLLY